MPIGNLMGLYGFLVLVPFIIIYLFKPKAVDRVIPSLMFFMKEQKTKQKFSFLRNILTNLIFLLQLLALSALAFSLAQPYLMVTKDASLGDTVFVIDSSASMQALDNDISRFGMALKEAKARINGKVSIIQASANPIIALENGKQGEALVLLSTLEPKDTSTNIKGSMDLADTIFEDNKGRVIVLSDFIATDEKDDPLISKRLLNSKGNSVEFVNLASKADNIGIVDLIVQKDITDVYIRNFNEKKETISIVLIKNGNEVKKQARDIEAGSKEKLVFTTLPGISKIEIKRKDDFMLDNVVYISSPLKERIKVLLITNSKPKFLQNALEAAGYVDVQVAEPPIIPDINHDVVIVSNVNRDELLPGAFKDIKKYLEQGGNLIITAQDGIGEIDMLDLLPVEIKGAGNKSNTVIASKNKITRDIEFGVVSKYIITALKEESASFLNAEDDSSLIAYKAYEEGNVVYYGLFDGDSEFKFTPDYPIFWNNLVNFLLETKDISDYNFKIGDRPLIDKAGIYKEGSKNVAYNLLDEKESDVSSDRAEFSRDMADFVSKDVKEKVKLDLVTYLVVFACLLILFEVVCIKFRGEI
ncbi:MAG: BatA and WFA domain-containing protein [Nanoarchaeota archaeon]|nr:BatA and WFA domain-containing protein [Nanoarchaeota archaeon]